MVREERRAARYAIMRRVLAKNQRGELVPITITDISEHGIGLFSKKKIDVGELLSFELALSNAMSITVQARLLWTRHSLGCRFRVHVRRRPAISPQLACEQSQTQHATKT
jgi:hypothetical protein